MPANHGRLGLGYERQTFGDSGVGAAPGSSDAGRHAGSRRSSRRRARGAPFRARSCLGGALARGWIAHGVRCVARAHRRIRVGRGSSSAEAFPSRRRSYGLPRGADCHAPARRRSDLRPGVRAVSQEPHGARGVSRVRRTALPCRGQGSVVESGARASRQNVQMSTVPARGRAMRQLQAPAHPRMLPSDLETLIAVRSRAPARPGRWRRRRSHPRASSRGPPTTRCATSPATSRRRRGSAR